jgi:trehalose 6-phosphate synthase
MPFFRMRLIVALALGITLVSVASTYFDVLSHKLVLRRELERRSACSRRWSRRWAPEAMR